MQKKTASKAHVERERDPAKLQKALVAKGYPSGKAPKGKEAHHVTPVAEGGKTTPKNIKVVSKQEHKNIHKQNRSRGGI